MRLKFKTMNLLELSAIQKKLLIGFVDSLYLALSLIISQSIYRDDFFGLINANYTYAVIIPLLLMIPQFLFSLSIFGLYRNLFRIFNASTFINLLKANIFFIAVVLVVAFIFKFSTSKTLLSNRELVFFFLVLLQLSIFSRATLAFLILYFDAPIPDKIKSKIIIYGATQDGISIIRSPHFNKHFTVVAFVETNPNLIGRSIFDIRIISPETVDKNYLELNHITHLVISGDRLSYPSIIDTLPILAELNITVVSIPNLLSISSINPVNFSRINITDILNRNEVSVDTLNIFNVINGKTILITGGCGSIGSEIVRNLLIYSPAKLIIFDNSENGIYNSIEELAHINGSTNIEFILGSINDLNSLNLVFDKWKIDIVFHAAAYKHVPIIEENIQEAVKTNIFGTANLLKLVNDKNVEKFILISTDKAVRSSNFMGASKRFAELLTISAGSSGVACKHSIVRFGNVLGSSGSVVPKFERQIKSGGPITLTDKRITRYFMSIPEAAQLVISSSCLVDGDALGTPIYILDMGDPILIFDLAKKMINLAGHSVAETLDSIGIRIIETGLRPGEKMHEELTYDSRLMNTLHPKISLAYEFNGDLDEIHKAFDSLEALIDNNSISQIKQLFIDLGILRNNDRCSSQPLEITNEK